MGKPLKITCLITSTGDKEKVKVTPFDLDSFVEQLASALKCEPAGVCGDYIVAFQNGDETIEDVDPASCEAALTPLLGEKKINCTVTSRSGDEEKKEDEEVAVVVGCLLVNVSVCVSECECVCVCVR